MTEAIMKIISSVFGWLVIKGLDIFIGKWIAYITIAWELSASEKAKQTYREALVEVNKDAAQKYGQWADWRKKAKNGSGSNGV